jgi:antitoxin component YwqK of YwqJK toxin-antitoxin module
MENKKELNFINLYNVKGEKHGPWEYYFSNGNLYSKGDYVNGNRHGLWEYYWSNGDLSSKGNYVAGKQHGYWEYYYSNGDLCYKCLYDQGKRVDYNPLEPQAIELSLDEIANRFGINVNSLKIKK